jgi:hypothetical protein
MAGTILALCRGIIRIEEDIIGKGRDNFIMYLVLPYESLL